MFRKTNIIALFLLFSGTQFFAQHLIIGTYNLRNDNQDDFLTDSYHGKYLSGHFPVLVEVTLK